MKRSLRALLLAAGGILSAAVHAGEHHVCYEAWPFGRGASGVVGCRTDTGGSCYIFPLTDGLMYSPYAPPTLVTGQQANLVRFDYRDPTGTFAAGIQFYDANGQPTQARRCDVNALGIGGPEQGPAFAAAELAGFTTDASGQLSTAIWRAASLASPGPVSRMQFQVPADFVAVGGGAVGVESPYGAMVAESAQPALLGNASPVCGWRCWAAQTSQQQIAEWHRATAFVIGLRIAGLPAASLRTQLRSFTAATTATPAAVASNQVVLPTTRPLVGSVVLSGSVRATAGQFVTATAPLVEESPPGCATAGDCRSDVRVTGWGVRSTDNGFGQPGTVQTAMLALPPSIFVPGANGAAGRSWRLRSAIANTTSAEMSHPVAEVPGLPEGYALTGIGAAVNWATELRPSRASASNMLWRLEPRMDGRSAIVASKDHIWPRPATITGWAIGLRLE